MNHFSCYVDVERFLGEPVKELAQFLCCFKRGKRFETIVAVANLLKNVNHLKDFYEFKTSRKTLLERLPLDTEEKKILWKLLVKFFLKQAENSAGKEIPQDDVIAIRKGRLFEEIVYLLGPAKKWKVDLVSMHCQPMINGKKVEIHCDKKSLTGKNIDVVFWGKDYVEGYECKSNLAFFFELGKRNDERSRKIRDKVRYLNLLAKTLKQHFKEVEITLASFTPQKNFTKYIPDVKRWISKCEKEENIHFKIKTIEDILKEIE
ncbi:hypothetical protein [Desulfurobacterium sp.]